MTDNKEPKELQEIHEIREKIYITENQNLTNQDLTNRDFDIVALDLSTCVMVGECKWKTAKVSMADYKNLVRKAELICESHEKTNFYLFSKSGFEENLIQLADTDQSIVLICADDLFS